MTVKFCRFTRYHTGLLTVALTMMSSMLAPAYAQFGGTPFGAPPAQQDFAPSNGPGAAPPPPPPASGPIRLAPPTQSAVPQPASPQSVISIPPGQAALTLNARFSRDLPTPITNGLVWRVYPARPDATRAFLPVKEDKAASPTLTLPQGDYVVAVSFGLASAVKTVSLHTESTRETFDLPAGGIRLEGRVGEARIPAGQISFDVYRGSQFDTGERQPLAANVITGDVVVVPDGTYYIVSRYGDSNAIVRSDIRVQTGKLTDVVISHRAAAITLKLVSSAGGEALANTDWTVLTPAGDVIKEASGAFPKVILSEGEYRVIARNENQTYNRDFKVTTGVDGEIEVLAK